MEIAPERVFSSIGTYCAVPYTSDVDVIRTRDISRLLAVGTFKVPLILVSHVVRRMIAIWNSD